MVCLGPQDGRGRQNHGAMAATPEASVFYVLPIFYLKRACLCLNGIFMRGSFRCYCVFSPSQNYLLKF